MNRNLSVYCSPSKQHTDSSYLHTDSMGMQHDSALTFAHNLQRLMDDRGLSQAGLARKSGVSQTSISMLLKTDAPSAINPRASTVEKLSNFFGIASWQMMMPNLPLELLKSPRLTKLLENYTAATDEGRRTVERIAEGEVRYSVAETIMTGNQAGKKAG